MQSLSSRASLYMHFDNFPKMNMTTHHAHLIHHTNRQSSQRRYLMILDIFVCNIIYIVIKPFN
jgi:hypothetical protein